jgi:hypothetical protein
MTVIYGGKMAFPQSNCGHGAPFDEGMSLRDYIAIHAMQALIDNDGLFSEIPTQAYEIADAMIEYRVSGEQ